MKVKQLMINYPGTIVEKAPFQPDEHMLYFYEDPYYIGVPSEALSDRERFMLKTLMNQEMPPDFSEKAQFWYDILIQAAPVKNPELERKIRMIQFQITGIISRNDLMEWRQALEAFFGTSACFVYLSSQRGLVIEEQMTITEDTLQAIANTLENDFSVKTHFQIGLRYPLSALIRDAYLEESRLFRQHVTGSDAKEVTSVENGFFSLLRPLMSEWAILGEVRTMIAEDTSWISIIRTIWENQGNISMAAKHLFMHRNTLQYRIDKFYEMTGISLKKMDGLTIAYLSTL